MFGFLFSLKQLVGKMSPKKWAPAQPSFPAQVSASSSMAPTPAQKWRLLCVQHEYLQASLSGDRLRPSLRHVDRPCHVGHARLLAVHLLPDLCRVPGEEPAVATWGAHLLSALHAVARAVCQHVVILRAGCAAPAARMSLPTLWTLFPCLCFVQLLRPASRRAECQVPPCRDCRLVGPPPCCNLHDQPV